MLKSVFSPDYIIPHLDRKCKLKLHDLRRKLKKNINVKVTKLEPILTSFTYFTKSVRRRPKFVYNGGISVVSSIEHLFDISNRYRRLREHRRTETILEQGRRRGA